jgi:hypothetical protein
LPKWVSVKNDGEYQGKVRYMISSPRGRVQMMVVSSVELVCPESYPLGKELVSIKASLNPSWEVEFELGSKLRYFDDSMR